MMNPSFLNNIPRPALIAMIHVGALPGSPRGRFGVDELRRQAVEEAKLLAGCGVDAIMLENMHDVPYLNRRVGPEITAGMTAVCLSVRQTVALPMGVQVLAGANREAIAVAHAAGCQFVRCEGFVFAHVADEGVMGNADAGRLLRYRKRIGADRVAVLADVKKKHASHAITADVALAEMAEAAIWCGADGVVVTGTATGRATHPEDVTAVRKVVKGGVFVGSGITPENVRETAAMADGLIVGSYLKKDGLWTNPPDERRVRRMVDAVAAARRAAAG